MTKQGTVQIFFVEERESHYYWVALECTKKSLVEMNVGIVEF